MAPLDEKYFNELFESADRAGLSEWNLKYIRDLKNVIDTAREEGREEGRKEVKEKGKKEQKMQIAKTMKLKGMSNQDISEITGLSEDEIENL